MGGGVESLVMENLMEWELVTDAGDQKPPSSAASTTSESAASNALVLEYLTNLDIDIVPRERPRNPPLQQRPSVMLRHDEESLSQSPEAGPIANPPSLPLPEPDLQSSVIKPEVSNSAESLEAQREEQSQAQQEEQSQGQQETQQMMQSGLDWAPMTIDSVIAKTAIETAREVLAEVSEEGKEADLKEEDNTATLVILRKVTELALLQKSLPKASEQGAALATIELLMRLEETVGGPLDGIPTVHDTLKVQTAEKAESATVMTALEGFFGKVTEALRLTEVRVQLTQAEEKARERRKKRMQFLGTVGGMSALLFVGAGAAVLAAEASLASAYTAYNIFFNPTAISAASAAVEAASGVASLCGLGAVVPGATAASLGVLDMFKAHCRPVKVGQVARLKMLDCMLGYLTEGSGTPYEPIEDPDVLKARMLSKWRELDLAALPNAEIVAKLTAEHAGRSARICGVATTNLTSASIETLVQHARLLDLVDQLEVLVWNTCFVGVIGPQNAGKSTLIKAMADALGRKDVGVADIGIKAHTKRVGAYQLKDTLWILDCPGSDSISDELAVAWQNFRSLPSFFVLVLHYGNGITRSVADLYQQVRARFPDTKIVTLVNQVDRYWDELEEDGVDESLGHLVEVLETAVGEKVDVRFSVLSDKKYDRAMMNSGVLGSDGACQRIIYTAEEMSRALADD
ncbi:hypothetical protein KFL_000070460 [Klebsormidium nitens]|uniref:G domain-containing protein n=1 Tax=Klebsormidium nitens TaxID=105231 RepID=A0A1Y1HQG9_KLENI|nr:hypothetical protein KFL_000070460 [Klebsormidium nitens]|eukprot:GAQ78078.1 hypothetical protein KFL_000070460 [Klebsormidium nitens]